MILLQPLLIAWFITYFEPLQKLFANHKVKYLTDILICFKCLAFWVTIIYCFINLQFTIYPAIINAFIAYIIMRIDNQFPTKL